jgi:hypothetical protein
MPKAAAIQMVYVLVTTPPRLAPQSTARQVYSPEHIVPARQRRVEDT